MRILVPPGVFRPRSDSWQLARCVAAATGPGRSVLDLCTGSGVVALVAARAGAAPVIAVDLSGRAAWTARLNGLLHGVRVRGRTGRLYEPVGGCRFDLIAANPPYLPGTGSGPPGLARAVDGGPDGRAVIDRIIDGAPAHLNRGGRLLLVHSSVCGIEETVQRMRAAGLAPRVIESTTGPLGPMLRERAGRLHRAGLLQDTRSEQVAVIEGSLVDGIGTG